MKVKVYLVQDSPLFFDNDGAELLCNFRFVITNNYRQ